MAKPKLNSLLAITDELAVKFKAGVDDYLKFFKGNQGAFKGEKNTFAVKDGMIDDPSKRSLIKVQTTVKEKIDYFIATNKEYVNALFSQEKTNASGNAKAELIVDGTSWGEFTSLELLRLKSLIDNGNFKTMLESIPVRSDAESWEPTTEEMYKNRTIFASTMVEGTARTTIKESYILPDPNLAHLKDTSKYTPQIASKDNTVEIGDYTRQRFTGEISHRERAAILEKRHKLYVAVIDALKRANDCEAQDSTLTSDKIFGYIFG